MKISSTNLSWIGKTLYKILYIQEYIKYNEDNERRIFI